MSLYIDRTNDKTTKIRKPSVCDGCGRVLPKGSLIHRRYISDYSDKWVFNWCNSCWEIIKKCRSDKIDVFNYESVREHCEKCDNYSLCELCEYLQNTKPGDVTTECLE